MRYLPAAVAALTVGVVVVVALFLTKNVLSLWALAGLWIVYRMIPFQENEH